MAGDVVHVDVHRDFDRQPPGSWINPCGGRTLYPETQIEVQGPPNEQTGAVRVYEKGRVPLRTNKFGAPTISREEFATMDRQHFQFDELYTGWVQSADTVCACLPCGAVPSAGEFAALPDAEIAARALRRGDQLGL